jgi:hypothetical protein
MTRQAEPGPAEGIKTLPLVVCERCRTRGAEILIVGELEGRAVWICWQCRDLRRPVVLT